MKVVEHDVKDSIHRQEKDYLEEAKAQSEALNASENFKADSAKEV